VRENARLPGEPAGPGPIQQDPLYIQTLDCMQTGDWAQAGELLASLQQLYPHAAEVQGLQQMLALRLSTEKNWAATSRRKPQALLEVPAVRALAIANLALYILIAVVWLLARMAAG